MSEPKRTTGSLLSNGGLIYWLAAAAVSVAPYPIDNTLPGRVKSGKARPGKAGVGIGGDGKSPFAKSMALCSVALLEVIQQ